MSDPLAPTAKPRMIWMDSLRGGAILLVILWHSSGILVRFGYGHAPDWLIGFNEFFAPYRMPTLMFLSGMLLPASLRKPLPTYFSGKLRLIAWPFVVWTVLWILLFPSPNTLLSFNLWTTSYLWYLLYILVFYAIAPLVRWVPGWILVLLPWVATGFTDDMNRRRFFFLMGFFFLGKLVAENRAVLDRVLASRWIWASVPIAVGFGVASAVYGPWRYYGLLAIFSVVGVLCGVKIAQLTTTRRGTAAIRFVGRNSLIYYVTHFPVITAIVMLGSTLGVPNGAMIVVGGIGALLVGTLAVWLSKHSWLRLLFAFPELRFRRSTQTKTITADPPPTLSTP
ncbi:acyltransferase [Leifsonia sp. YIM 134122]|uniref:Acyltransferase n=1 Tax=Leifsonia stereocauli TaxID=3134136 RepID=A0ABU9W7J5_9MICO